MPGSLRSLVCLLSVVAALGCDGSAADGDAGPDTPPGDDAGAGVADAGTVDASRPTFDAGEDASAEAGRDAWVPPLPCAWDDPRPPPLGTVLWPDVLNATGADTLGGHGHDDGRGAVGFCAGTRIAGEPFHRLIAVGFETDADITGDGDDNDALPVDFWRDASAFDGVGESAGRINVYVEVVDETGAVLDRNTSPDVRIVREIRDGPTDRFGLDDKPANEFQTNFPMTGGGATYAVEIEGASDRVFNLRLPVNHHVTFVLVFRRVTP